MKTTKEILDSLSINYEGTKDVQLREARNMKTLAWNELLSIQRVHEVHLQNWDHLSKKDFVAFKSGEISSRRKENKSFSIALKVNMVESNNSYNSSWESIDDEVALMSRNFKQMKERKV